MTARLELRVHAGRSLAQQGLERDGLAMQLHPAGRDLGEVEQLVDELQQVTAVARDGVKIVPLRLTQGSAIDLARQQQVAEPDHAVERGPELVRNVREELVLELACLVELEVQPRQLAVLLLELVVQRREGHVLRFEALRRMPHLDGEPAGVLVGRFALARDREVGRRLLERRTRVSREVGGEQHDQQPHQPAARAERDEGETAAGVRDGSRAGDRELLANRVGRGAGVVNHIARFTHELAHHVARQRVGGGATHRGRRPFVRVVVWLVQREGGGAGDRREHLQRRAEAPCVGAPFPSPRGRIEHRQQPGHALLYTLAPREGTCHAVHAARDHPELLGLLFVQPLSVLAGGHAL